MSEEKKEMKKSSSPAKDLTVGSPMKLILGFAFPMFLGLLFQQFYSLVDTMIVGKYLGVDPFAGVGSTGSLNFIVIGFCMGLCSGFSVPISQSFGAKDFPLLRKMVTNSVWLCTFFSVVITTLMLLFCRPVLTWMNTPENIFEYAYIYIFIIFAGIPCTILYNMTAAILRALRQQIADYLPCDFVCHQYRSGSAAHHSVQDGRRWCGACNRCFPGRIRCDQHYIY